MNSTVILEVLAVVVLVVLIILGFKTKLFRTLYTKTELDMEKKTQQMRTIEVTRKEALKKIAKKKQNLKASFAPNRLRLIDAINSQKETLVRAESKMKQFKEKAIKSKRLFEATGDELHKIQAKRYLDTSKKYQNHIDKLTVSIRSLEKAIINCDNALESNNITLDLMETEILSSNASVVTLNFNQDMKDVKDLKLELDNKIAVDDIMSSEDSIQLDTVEVTDEEFEAL